MSRTYDATFESVQERELRDAGIQSCEWMRTSGGNSKVSHAICLKDLVESFNAKSALTVRDLCLVFPEVIIHVSALHWTLCPCRY